MSKYTKFAVAALIAGMMIFPAMSLALDMDMEAPERVRLGIMRFESKTYDVPDRLAASITDIFGRYLFKSKGIMLVEREKLDDVMKELKLGMSGLVDEDTAAEIGRLAGCDYMLMGSITNLARASSGVAVPLFVVPVSVGSANQKVKATLDIRVVKVETGEIVLAETADGTATKSDTAVSAYGVGYANSEFGGIEGTAIAKATMALAPKIEKELTGRDTLTKIFEAETKSSKGKKGKGKGKSEEKSATVNRPKKKKSAEEPAPSETEAVRTSGESQETDGTIGASSAPAASSAQKRPAFANKSTKPDAVIRSYGLSVKEAGALKARHTKIAKMGNTKRAYEEYVSLAEEFSYDYLAAYKAGEVAGKLKDKENAKKWYSRALEINPDYEPAQKALAKL